ncbi:START domain-containing protein [Segetibacter koreensis]|uniref:START domain-containing protein n=1 Tax=Segetibacter koreensis TaxID=398037 RepID=UPI00037E1AA7|nr:START domain-containing protein [Segetibacter koreensis]
MNVKTAILFFFVAITNVSYGQTNWELTKDKNGIKVYTATEGESKYKSIKVEAVLAGTLQKLVNILRDVGKNKEWVYSTKQSYPIRQISGNEILYYSETELPWPVSNRDIAVRMRFNLNPAKNTLKVVASGEPGAFPIQKGVVRLQFFSSTWDVKYVGNNKISISYYLKMDPSGNVPAPVTNMFITKGPYETFENLGKLLN